MWSNVSSGWNRQEIGSFLHSLTLFFEFFPGKSGASCTRLLKKKLLKFFRQKPLKIVVELPRSFSNIFSHVNKAHCNFVITFKAILRILFSEKNENSEIIIHYSELMNGEKFRKPPDTGRFPHFRSNRRNESTIKESSRS